MKRAYFYGVAPISPGSVITVKRGKEFPDFILVSEMIMEGTLFRGPERVPAGALFLRPSEIVDRRYRADNVVVDFTEERAETRFDAEEQER